MPVKHAILGILKEAEPAIKPRPLRDELFVKLLFVSRENPELALRLIERQTHIYMEQMRELTETKYRLTKVGLNRDNMMTDLLSDAALFHAEADVRWLSHVEAKILSYART